MSTTHTKGNPLAQAKTTSADTTGQRYPYTVLGGLVIAGLAAVLSLLMLGVTGPGFFTFTLSAAFLGMGSAVLILTLATLYLFFTLRSTSLKFAAQQKELQALRDLAQDGRLVSLETTRTGSKASSNVRDERLSSLEDSHMDSQSGAAGMMIEIERLESRIASLETPRVAPAKPLASLVPIVVPVMAATAPSAPAAPARPTPFGDVHAVIDIEGIGPHYGVLLNAANVFNTRQLWEADPEQVAATLELPVATVDKWQQMCELLAVKGIGPQYAELLVRSGVTSIPELRDAAPAALLSALAKTQLGSDVRIQGNTIGAPTVANWIRAARDHKAGRTIHPYPSGPRATLSP
ncbi:MAG TPA: DUF4332 domain-containing protein [Candidatus Thermoplasmatota archaeon]|nr:DUF4332 domain-containing protein [Candidatus Thermoplasmatota archaeon]